MQTVVNLVAWGGADFNFMPGDLVEMPDDMASDRIAAGIARIPTKKELAAGDILQHPALNPPELPPEQASAADPAPEAVPDSEPAPEAAPETPPQA